MPFLAFGSCVTSIGGRRNALLLAPRSNASVARTYPSEELATGTMEKERVSSKSVFDPSPGNFSNAIKYGNLVFTTAKSGATPSGRLPRGIEAQTRQALENLRALLEAAGTDMEHVLKTTIYATSTRGFEKVNRIYAGYFRIPPARAIAIVKGWGDRDRLIEIDAVAGMP
jgi:2-iminobutanoate/2-iminopropanoate deaminase